MKWIFFVSRRFAKVDRSGRSAVTGFLASLSICFGVMTLIVTVSVMNGFQMGFIDSIMEISSAHIRVTAEGTLTRMPLLMSVMPQIWELWQWSLCMKPKAFWPPHLVVKLLPSFVLFLPISFIVMQVLLGSCGWYLGNLIYPVQVTLFWEAS